MGASLLFARHARKFNGNIRRSACHGPTTGRLLGSSRANPLPRQTMLMAQSLPALLQKGAPAPAPGYGVLNASQERPQRRQIR